MSTNPIFTQPAAYYPALVTSEYQSSPNLLAWLSAALSPLSDAAECLGTITPSFDLATATGTQLNVLGQLIGVSRTVGFQPSNSVSPVLDDTTYRTLLMARIAQNQWDGTIDGLQTTWQQLFPGGRIAIEDAQNMTATIILSGAFTSIIEDLITHGYIVPRPEGVLYSYSFSTLPIFGFSPSNGTYIAGFDAGHWS